MQRNRAALLEAAPWISGTGATDQESLARLRMLIESGYREQDNEE